MQHFGDLVRQLHRLVDLGFPEFTRYIRKPDSELASAVLHDFPTAQAFQGVTVRSVGPAVLRRSPPVRRGAGAQRPDRSRQGLVGHHHGFADLQVRHACEDLDVLRRRLRELEHDIERFLKDHEVGSLLTTIGGIGVQTSARLIAELGDPALFRNSACFCRLRRPGARPQAVGQEQHTRAGITTLGNASLRAALWMPTLTAVQKNPGCALTTSG